MLLGVLWVKSFYCNRRHVERIDLRVLFGRTLPGSDSAVDWVYHLVHNTSAMTSLFLVSGLICCSDQTSPRTHKKGQRVHECSTLRFVAASPVVM